CWKRCNGNCLHANSGTSSVRLPRKRSQEELRPRLYRSRLRRRPKTLESQKRRSRQRQPHRLLHQCQHLPLLFQRKGSCSVGYSTTLSRDKTFSPNWLETGRNGRGHLKKQ